MGQKFRDVLLELKMFFSSKVIDALVPPFIFMLGNLMFDLKLAALLALAAALFFVALRLWMKETFLYAFGGLMGAAIASGLAYFTNNAANYFLPKLVTSGGLLIISLISLLIHHPIAMWASHLTRRWPITWYVRGDVQPAYIEVSWMWIALLVARFIVLAILILRDNLAQLTFFNILLGTPLTISVLVVSYLYGLWRLNRLGGPSVQEYIDRTPPPWKGQTRGF